VTVSAVETIIRPHIAASSDTVTITTTLVATDRVVIIVSKDSTAGTPSASGLGGTWVADVANTSTVDLYVLSAAGMTGTGVVTVNNMGVGGYLTAFVLRSDVGNAVRFTAGNAANGNSLTGPLGTSSATELAGSFVIGAAYISVSGGTGVFPEASSSPSSGWTSDRASTSYVIHRILTGDTSIAVVASYSGGSGWGGAVARASYYDDHVPVVPPTVTVPADFAVLEGDPVSITATASDSDGTIVSYAWTIQSAGPIPPTLSGASTATVSFVAAPQTIVLRCTVTDDDGATAYDEITVTVGALPIEDGVNAGIIVDGITIPFDVLQSARVKIDETWSPYVQATVTVITKELELIDPTADPQPRIVLTLSQTGLDRVFDLAVQRRVANNDGSTTLELVSDDMRLHEYRRVATSVYQPTTGSLREIVSDVLEEVGFELDPFGANALIDPTKFFWTPGQSAWEYLAQPVQVAGMRLWCDENRVFHLTAAPAYEAGSVVVAFDGDNMVGYADEINRDTWFDAVIITYKWTDVLGDDYVVYDTATTAGFTSVYAETRDDTPYPGPGTAAGLLSRYLTRGRTIPTTAIADYRATPGMTALVTTPDTGNRAGFITSVEWDQDHIMRVDARDVRVVPDQAWLYQLAGEAWTDGPVGESWLEA